MATHAMHGQISLNNNAELRKMCRRIIGLKGYVKNKKSKRAIRKYNPDSPKIIKANQDRVLKTRIEYAIGIGILLVIFLIVL